MKSISPWLAAAGLSFAFAVPAHAALNATVYEGWGLDSSGNISTAGLTALGSFQDPQVDHWNGTQDSRWTPLGRDDLFTVIWTGALIAPTEGTYLFRTTSDDGVQLFLDGQAVISSTHDQWFGINEGVATLDGGAHTLKLALYENLGHDGIRLEWMTPGSSAWAVIPATALTAVPEPSAWLSALAGLGAMSVALRRRHQRRQDA